MNYEIIYKERFLDDLKKHSKSGQKKLLLKVQSFIDELKSDPRSGTGKPEQLKFMKNEIWSRRINEKHRLVYEISENEVILLTAWGHYSDK